MDPYIDAELKRIIDEVFWREDRYVAELRLLPAYAETLVQYYGAQCLLMDEDVCPDGKRWYRVWMPIDKQSLQN